MVKGAHYSVGQLIEQMISYSDNEAFYTLADHFDTNTNKYFELIFKDLNIPSPVGRNEKSLYAMSVGDYSLPFRVLYGSTYLSERYSERALALLSRSHFREGIVAGVPASVKVAHKFGVINAPMQDGSITPNELHDCGIVYNESAPYFLCIMTEGKDLRPLRETIQGVSDIVYREMTKQR